MSADVAPAAAFEDNHSADLHKIRHGVSSCDGACPSGHTFDRGKESAHQDEDHHEEKGDEHDLLLGLAGGGNEQAQAKHGDEIDNEIKVEEGDVADGDNAVERAGDGEKSDGKNEETNGQKGDGLGE